MFSIAAAASRQGGFGTETGKRYKERQEKKRKENTRHRPQTEAVGTRGTTTAHFKTRHKPVAIHGAFLSSITGNEKT